MKRYILAIVLVCVALSVGKNVGMASQKEEIADIVIEPVKEKEWVAGDAVLQEDFVIYAIDEEGQVLSNVLENDQLKLQPECFEEAGDNVVSVEYGPYFAHTTVFVQKEEIEGITANLREECSFGVGEKIGKKEICVYAYYNSGLKKEITADVQMSNTSIQLGQNVVHISYEAEGKSYQTTLEVIGTEKKLATDKWQVNKSPKPTSLILTGSSVTATAIAGIGSQNTTISPQKTKTPPVTINSSQKTELPQKTKAPKKTAVPTATPVPVSYQLKSSWKGVGISAKKKKVYVRKKGKCVLKTKGITKVEYQLVSKGKKKTKKWKKVTGKTISVKKQGDWQLYLRFTTASGKKIEKKTNRFIVDWTAPDVSGIKNGKIYSGAVKFQCKDSVSGMKKITLNGKKCKNTVQVSKNGTYKVCAQDKAGNQKKIQFTIKKPVITPKPVQPTITEEPFISVQSVRCNKSSMQMKVGESKPLSATVLPENATNKSISWRVSNSNILSVSASGTVKAKQKGTAYVIVRSNSNASAYATCVVYVQ